MKRKLINHLLLIPVTLSTSLSLADSPAVPTSPAAQVLASTTLHAGSEAKPGSKPKTVVRPEQAGRSARLEQLRQEGKRQAAAAAYQLALQAVDQKDLGDADRLFAEAVLLQPDNADYLAAAARTSYSLKNYKAAEVCLLKLLGRYRAGAAAGQPKSIPVLSDLATLYQAQGRTAASRSALLEEMVLRRKFFGDNHPGMIDNFYRLAELELASSNLGEARHYLEEAITLVEHSRGDIADRDVAAVYHNIGELYRAGGQYEDAQNAYQKAMELWNKSPATNQQAIALTTRSLGRLRAQKAKAAIARINAMSDDQLNAPPLADPVSSDEAHL